MKRFLVTIRLFAVAMLLVMGVVFTGPAAHAAPPASAARSVWVIVRNNSNYPLSLQDSYVTRGEWTAQPNNVIQPGQESGFGSESNGFMTGTHGSVTYNVSNGQHFSFTWTNPYAGSNTYSSALSTVTYPGLSKVVMTRSGGSGNNAVVVITISNA